MENFAIAEIGDIGDILNNVFGNNITNFDLSNLQYFENVDIEEFLNITSSIFDLEISYYENNDLYVSISGYTTKHFPKKFKRLNLERLLVFTRELARVVIEDYQYGNLRELRKAYFVNKSIQQVLSNYMFLKESDKVLLNQELPDVELIVSLIKNKTNKVLKDINPETLSVLKSTLDELGIDYKLEKQKEDLVIKFN